VRDLSRIIGLLQVDSTIGDLSGNSLRLETLASIAKNNGASMCITTELAVSGYPPRDLLLQPDFVKMSQEQASSISVDIPVLVGTPVVPEGERKLPGNGVVRAGPLSSHPSGEQTNRVVTRKQLLPSYDVFDETRYFQASNRSGICRTIGDLDLGVTICEDAWQAAGLTPSAYGSDPIENLA
jgi:predicted amidohydrolase